jgi:hypothetical protein
MPTKVNSLWLNPRLLIALHSPSVLCETVLRVCPPENAGTVTRSQQSGPFSAVRFAEEESRKTGNFRVFRWKEPRNFSVVKTCWRRECDSNSHYRFEFRNPRRLRNLQAMQHLTRESTGSDWPLGRLRTVHLFVLSLRRTAYDIVAESGHLRASARDRHWVRNDYLLGRAVQTKKSFRSACRKKANKSRFSEILARAFLRTSGILAGEDEIPFVRSFSALSVAGDDDYFLDADFWPGVISGLFVILPQWATANRERQGSADREPHDYCGRPAL